MTKRINPEVDGRLKCDVQAILALQAQEYTDRKIAGLLGINHKTVATHRRRNGLMPNGRARRFLKIVDTVHAQCSRCHEIKPLAGWPVQRKNGAISFRLSFCADCKRTQYNRSQNRSHEANLKNRWNRLKVRSKKSGIEFDISFESFMGQWHQQRGRCFYTDTVLVTNFGIGFSPNACSVDKVEPALGYVLGNVVFASNRVNTVKSDISLEEMRDWMPGWFARVISWRERGIPCAQVAEGDF